MVLIPPIRRTPTLLAVASRAAGAARRPARITGVVLIGVMLLAFAGALRSGPAPIDPSLPNGIVDGVRHGARFYDVAADASRQAGLSLTILRLPLPALALVTGAVSLAGAIAAQWVLGVAVVLAWWARMPSLVHGRAGRAIGGGLIAIGVAGVAWPALVTVPETWAGLLVALSLARWRPDRPLEAAAFGLAAATIAPAALAYLGVMATGASVTRHRREVVNWAIAGLVGLVVLAGHAHALAALAEPIDLATPQGGGFVPSRLASVATAGEALPFAVAAALFAPALVGWAAWQDPVATRVLGQIVATALIAFLTGSSAIGLIAVPLLPFGLLALPDLTGDLVASAFDKRRITVTRLTR